MPFDREIPNDALGYVEPDEEDEMPGDDDSDPPRATGDGAAADPADRNGAV
jgi:hypothetical protein